MVPLDTRIRALIHRQEPSKGDRQVVPQGTEFPTLILQVVDQFGIFPVFSGKDLAQLKDGRVDCAGAVFEEDLFEG